MERAIGDNDPHAVADWSFHIKAPFSLLYALDSLIFGELPPSAVRIYPADISDSLMRAEVVAFVDATHTN